MRAGVLTAVALLASTVSASINFTKEDAAEAYAVTEGLVKNFTPRDAGTIRGHLAGSWILGRASRMGADTFFDDFKAETPDGVKSFRNVFVEVRGIREDAPWIILMSHYDTAPLGIEGFQGANDGASTTGLLVALVGAVKRHGRLNDNIAFVWTDAEEARKAYGPNDGFQGSKRLVEYYGEKKRRVKAAIGLDMLGDKNLHIAIPANCTPALRQVAFLAAKRSNQVGLVSSWNQGVKDDFSQFYDAGCPAIDLIDFEYGSAPGRNDWWHTAADRIDKVSVESLYASGRLVAEMLNIIEGYPADPVNRGEE